MAIILVKVVLDMQLLINFLNKKDDKLKGL